MAVQIQLRRATASEWTAANPVLAVAEMALETDTNQFKIGDGSTAWNSLEYGGIQGEQGSGLNVASTQPVSPSAGDLWLNDTDGQVFVYYDDGTSQQWIPASSPTVTVSGTAPTGYEGQLWLDSTDGSMYVNYTDPGSSNSSWIGAVSRSGGILQVVSTTKTDTFSSSSTSFADVTGLSVNITPSSTSSKILVMASLSYGLDNASNLSVRLSGGNSGNYVADTAGSRISAAFGMYGDTSNSSLVGVPSGNIMYLDSPATTSTITYKVQVKTNQGQVFVNRATSDVDSDTRTHGASSITVMEVAG